MVDPERRLATHRERWVRSGVPPSDERAAQHQALREVIESGILEDPAGGPKVSQLEQEFARYVGVTHGVGASSGSAALAVALIALGIGRGDEVIVPALTFIASATAVALVGASPVFADVDPRTMAIDADGARRHIGPHTRAIMPVHLLGYPADMGSVLAVAEQHGLAVIEDCCQGHGASVGSQRVGSMGTVGCFSFAKRHLISAGGGGMLTTDDPELARRARRARFHGIADIADLWGNERDYDLPGFNFGMSELFAALALLEVPMLDQHLERRSAIAAIYDEVLGDLSFLDPVTLNAAASPCHHNYALRVSGDVRVDRDRLADELRDKGVSLLVNMVPLHRVSAFAGRCDAAVLPAAEDVARRLIVLELDHAWSSAEAHRQAMCVASAVQHCAGA